MTRPSEQGRGSLQHRRPDDGDASGPDGFAPPTGAVQALAIGRECEVLDALGIRWREGRPHIRCPYPAHADHHPSWRWDQKAARARCTCSKSDSIFDVVMKVEGGSRVHRREDPDCPAAQPT
jgi:hypothetical protein